MSEAPKLAPAPKKFHSYNPNFKTDEEKKEKVCSHNHTKPLYTLRELSFVLANGIIHKLVSWHGYFALALQLMSAMIEKMGDQDEEPLPQENMDGCDSDEWSD